MSPRELHQEYKAALSKIVTTTSSKTVKKQMPIIQRERCKTEKEFIQDAANALSALWKTGKPQRV